GFARACDGPRGAGRRLHHLSSSDDAGQSRHHRIFRLGDELPGIQGDGGAGVAVERAGRLSDSARSGIPCGAAHRGGGVSGAARAVPRVKYRPGATEEGKRIVPEEVAIAFTYGRTTHAVMMASPQDLEDFALGFSLSEGIIEAPADLTGLDIVRVPEGI